MNRLRVSSSYVFVFLTGATALVYEVVWQRYLARLTGSDSLATALVLGIFLAGLSGGYALCGWLSRRFQQPGRIYAGLEAIIGFWGLIFPSLFAVVSSTTRSWSFASPGWLLLQGSVCTLVLIGLPTVCMGGTVPLLTRVLAESLAGATRIHARLYGTNTAGAFVGVLGAGYLLVPGLGLPGSLRSMAVINLLAAVFFLCSSWPVVDGDVPDKMAFENERSASTESNSPVFSTWTLYMIAALNGAAVMALENVMIRITNLTLGSSSYSFSLLVSVFVLSLACGSFAVSWLRRLPRGLLFGTQTVALAAWWLVFAMLDDWPYAAHLLRAAFQSNGIGFWLFQGAVLAALLATLIVPVGLLGATLPLIFHELKRDLRSVGWHSGRMFSANAAGCVIGSVVCGWLLFYPLDNPGVLTCALALVAVSAALASWPLGKLARLAALGVLAVAVVFSWRQPDFDKKRFAHGTFNLDQMTPFSYRGPKYFYDNFMRDRKVEFYDDCPEGAVAVVADSTGGAPAELSQLLPGMPLPSNDSSTSSNSPLAIMVNGKSDSHTKLDQQTLKLSADIPALWAAHRSKALVIGLGTGVTVGELSLYPEMKSIDVAELSSGVTNALPLFAAFTHAVQNDPRLHVYLGDAFRVLGRSHERWDIIVSEPSNPWVTGVDMLFSHEFYQLAREHLTDDGVLLQWLQKYAIDPQTFGILMNTVRSEFPDCCIYQGEAGDLLVLASKRPLTLADQERAETVLRKNPAVQASLAEIGINSFAQLRERERMGLLIVADQLKNAGTETLDRPRVHYRAGWARFIGMGLEQAAQDPSEPETMIISSAAFHQTVEMRLQTNALPSSN